MSQKDNIIDNVGDFTAPELLKHIVSGVVTVPEILRENPGEFPKTLRTELEGMLWNEVNKKGDKERIELYLRNYPSGANADKAQAMLRELVSIKQNTDTDHESKATDEPHNAQHANSGVVTAENRKEDPSVHETLDEEETRWQQIDKTDRAALYDYITYYPDGRHVREARSFINQIKHGKAGSASASAHRYQGKDWLRHQIASGTSDPTIQANIIIRSLNEGLIKNSDLLSLIGEDHNFLSLPTIELLIQSNILIAEELKDQNVDKDFIDVLEGKSLKTVKPYFDSRTLPGVEKIDFKSQEVYFWGIPSSGKTCALGAILSAANSGRIAKSMEKYTTGNGYQYMSFLADTFVPEKIGYLPPRTDDDFVAAMCLTLQDEKDRLHALTLIDLAGEMLYAMYLMNSGRISDLTATQTKGYETMRSLLVDKKSKNPKIHFFVVEYDAHERKHKGVGQDDLLSGALSHIKSLGILDNTDAVFLIVTKADKAYDLPGDFAENIRDYIRGHYRSFYNNLSLNTRKINGGEVEIYPFSLGEVCFQDLCKFEDDAANQIVRLFLKRTPGIKTDKIGSIFQSLSK